LGAAVSGAQAGEFDIDLVPTSVGKERAEKALLPKVAVAGVLALAGAGFFAYAAESTASDAEAKLRKVKPVAEEVSRIAEQIEAVQGKYQKTMQDIDKVAEIYNMRYAYADIIRQLSARGASVRFWFTEFAPLINYDVAATSLTESAELKGTRLIDMNRSRNAGNDSAINQAPDEADAGKRNKAPKVTAIYVSGYTIKNPGDERSTAQRQAIYDLVDRNFDERSADSLFSYENAVVQKDLNHYFQFIDSKASKGKMPDYVEKFMMVMPLKTPIAIPELDKGNK
ncbi:MAG: hypothetical protein ACI4OS_04800, partial [Akkermansia sp.]